MAVALSLMLTKLASLLQEKTASPVRVKADEAVRWINEAAEYIVARRPDATATAQTFALVAGVDQTVPASAYALLDVRHNLSGKKRVIRRIDEDELDTFDPEWRNATQSGEIKHWMYDEGQPRTFRVDPPAVAGTEIQVVVSVIPTPATVPASSAAYTDVSGNFALADVWEIAAVNYAAYRALSKDAENQSIQAVAAALLGLVDAEISGQAAVQAGSTKKR